MIKLLLSKKGTNTTYDLARRIDASGEGRITLTDEREWGAFERVHSDLQVRLSALNGSLPQELLEARGQDKWNVQLIDEEGTRRFNGQISIAGGRRLLRDKYLEFTAWSKSKIFWERMKELYRVKKPVPGRRDGGTLRPSTMTLAEFFEMLRADYSLDDSTDAYQGVLIAAEYAARTVRYTGGPNWQGTEGAFVDIDEDMTFEEIFNAMRRYYNAELFIDHHTDQLTLQRRNSWNGTTRDIDSVIRSDEEIPLKWLDETRYDWLHTFKVLEAPAPTVLSIKEGADGFQIGKAQSWLYTVELDGIDTVLLSKQLTVEMPVDSAVVSIAIPKVPYTAKSRALYRLNYLGDGTWRMVGKSWDNASEATFIDPNPSQTATYGALDTKERWFDQYQRFDEATNAWQEPLLLTRGIHATGKILDVRPQLRFYEFGTTTPKDRSDYDSFSFFNRDMTDELFCNQFLDLFITQRGPSVKVKGTNYPVGLGIRSKRLPAPPRANANYDYLVRRSVTDYINKTTQLDLVSA